MVVTPGRVNPGEKKKRMQQKLKSLLLGMHSSFGIATLEDSLVVSYKVKHHLTMQPSNCPLRCPHIFENKFMQKPAYEVHINNYQKLEATKISFNK